MSLSKSAKTRWGIIGLGKIAEKFASDLLQVEDAELYAVASRSQATADSFAQKYGAKNAFGNYQQLADCQDVDIVYIATPHAQHHQNVLQCLNAGRAVLNEKAFALNLGQAQEMVILAREKKLFLMEALWTRYHPAIAKVLEIVNAGAIGEIVHIVADFGFKAEYDVQKRLFNPELAGGSLLDIGIYPLFISKLLLGNPTQVKAVGVLTPTGVDMNCSMALKFKNGVTASLFSTLATQTDTTAIIYGTKGKLLMHGRFHETFGLTLTLHEEEPQEFVTERNGWGYGYEIIDAQRCLKEGRTENDKYDLQQTLEMMALLDEIRQQIGVVYPMEE